MIKIILISATILLSNVCADEGMWPLSEISGMDLRSKGFKITADEIYNPGGISMVNGIVRLNGCTASFVSSDGLLLTNHHCAFSAIQRASTIEHDYLTNGFFASGHEEEIPAAGYRARLIDSYRDVSDSVLSGISPEIDFEARDKLIRQNIKKIVKEAETENPGKRAEVSEMFIGKTYVLFIYTELLDIRLVYAPPRSVGEFGGEDDNWVWPRHTGDFSFFRAYVSPDGSPAEYAPENIAFHPKKYFRIASGGVSEEDFVFILGYPGRTYRQRTSYFLEYEEHYRMPFVADLLSWQIDRLQKFIDEDPARSFFLSNLIKGHANTMKNYQGKMLGMARLDLTNKKRQEEQEMLTAFAADPEKQQQLKNILAAIRSIYKEKEAVCERELLITYLTRSPNLMNTARTLYEHAANKGKPDLEREPEFMDRNLDRTRRNALLRIERLDREADLAVLADLINRTQMLQDDNRIIPLDDFLSRTGVQQFLTAMSAECRLSDADYVTKYWDLDTNALAATKDPAIGLFIVILPEIRFFEHMDRRHEGALKNLLARLTDLRKSYFKERFIPDANGTMRLTFGHIRGYSPADAVFLKPITTFSGVVGKTTGTEPFITPPDLIRIYQNHNLGPYIYPPANDIPTCILYDTDTTGGNSGSPVFNANGELVGLNFDRAFEATVNDFGWSEDYSRSIGVDIRYILWILDKYSGANHILEDLGVRN
jgi:hypothetical protein